MNISLGQGDTGTTALLRRGYAICTSPRSGSNFLCQLLSTTGVLGHPLEYFNGPARRVLTDPSYPQEPAEQIAWILQRGATPNGVFGVKLFAEQHDAVAAQLPWTRALPNQRFVYLARQDLLGQAISWARALQTSQYRSTQPIQGVAVYDGALIRNRIEAIARECARWSMFFARTGIEPVRLLYEDIVKRPQEAVDRVAALVGLERPAIVVPSGLDLAIQRDGVTDEWRARFCAEQGDPDFVNRL